MSFLEEKDMFELQSFTRPEIIQMAEELLYEMAEETDNKPKRLDKTETEELLNKFGRFFANTVSFKVDEMVNEWLNDHISNKSREVIQ